MNEDEPAREAAHAPEGNPASELRPKPVVVKQRDFSRVLPCGCFKALACTLGGDHCSRLPASPITLRST